MKAAVSSARAAAGASACKTAGGIVVTLDNSGANKILTCDRIQKARRQTPGFLLPQGEYNEIRHFSASLILLNLTKLSDSTYQKCIKIILKGMLGPDYVTFLPSDFSEAERDRRASVPTHRLPISEKLQFFLMEVENE